MFIEGGTQIHFTCTSQTALLVDGDYGMVTSPGNFSVSEVDVKYDGGLIFTDQNDLDRRDMLVSVPDLEVKHRGKVILRNRAVIESGYVDLESQGLISLDGTGFLANSGPGAGRILANGRGSMGASHGGSGGHAESGEFQYTYFMRCIY